MDDVHGAFMNKPVYRCLNTGIVIVKHTIWKRGEEVMQPRSDALRMQWKRFDSLAKGFHLADRFHEIEFRSFGEVDKTDPVSRGKVTDELIDPLRAPQGPRVDQIRRNKENVNGCSP